MIYKLYGYKQVSRHWFGSTGLISGKVYRSNELDALARGGIHCFVNKSINKEYDKVPFLELELDGNLNMTEGDYYIIHGTKYLINKVIPEIVKGDNKDIIVYNCHVEHITSKVEDTESKLMADKLNDEYIALRGKYDRIKIEKLRDDCLKYESVKQEKLKIPENKSFFKRFLSKVGMTDYYDWHK